MERSEKARELNLAASISSNLDDETLESSAVLKILDENMDNKLDLKKHDSLLSNFTSSCKQDQESPLLDLNYAKGTNQFNFQTDYLVHKIFERLDHIA
jgi:hypothetical protein